IRFAGRPAEHNAALVPAPVKPAVLFRRGPGWTGGTVAGAVECGAGNVCTARTRITDGNEASVARGPELIGRAFEVGPVADLLQIAVTASGAAGLALWSGPNPALAVVTGSNRAELACRGLGILLRRRAGLPRRGAGCIARLDRGDAAPRTRLLTGGALAAPLP